ncbi:DUF4357 domain-containing protein [Halochromatium roseum]|uniref:DUF4357 domain-containing protein n=1 Tax=Halochromatium roseum TaxID=391920 RepID=UPI001912A751|nr:DUF4357 domain-containing protein [Halochromatium roseum]
MSNKSKGEVMAKDGKTWPKPGDRLTHASRKTGETYEAVVLQADEQAGTLTVRVGSETFSSLSAAAASLTGKSTNGWIYWGLKKQQPKRQ